MSLSKGLPSIRERGVTAGGMFLAMLLKEINKIPTEILHIQEINPEYALEGLMLKLKFQYFGHLM